MFCSHFIAVCVRQDSIESFFKKIWSPRFFVSFASSGPSYHSHDSKKEYRSIFIPSSDTYFWKKNDLLIMGNKAF